MFKRLFFLFKSILSLLILLFLSTAVTADTLGKKSELFNIKIKSVEACANCDGKTTITLNVEDIKKGTKREIVFASRAVKVHDLHILDSGRILVKGELATGGDILTIIDINTSRPIDILWGRDSAISHDEKVVAYKFRYPPHGLSLNYSDVVLAYDLSKSPLENSMGTASIDDPTQRGFILYPNENRINKEYYRIAKKEEEMHELTSPLIWNNNDVIFLDSFQEKTFFVTIELTADLLNPKTDIQELDKKLFYKEQYLKHLDKEFAKAALVAEELKITDDGNFVEIKPFASGPFEGKKVKIKLHKK